jgi:hypothetical protein
MFLGQARSAPAPAAGAIANEGSQFYLAELALTQGDTASATALFRDASKAGTPEAVAAMIELERLSTVRPAP